MASELVCFEDDLTPHVHDHDSDDGCVVAQPMLANAVELTYVASAEAVSNLPLVSNMHDEDALHLTTFDGGLTMHSEAESETLYTVDADCRITTATRQHSTTRR